VAAPSDEHLHGGRLVARTLRAHGVSTLFTLSGGHLFSIYDGCRAEGIDLVDVRHEQTAAFAAEGWAKVTRSPGVCALTAGPGVTNGMSAIASASQNESPLLVLGGRSSTFPWTSCSRWRPMTGRALGRCPRRGWGRVRILAAWSARRRCCAVRSGR